MGKIMLNDIEYSGGIVNAQGVFIDTDNVIVATTSWTTSMTYTATQDCIVVIENDAYNSHIKITIDGVEIYDYGTSGQYVSIKQPFAVKKGQVIGATTTQSNQLSYTVYGIQAGTNTSGQIDYSTTEQKTGQKWIDGKDIWQKTIVKSNLSRVTESTVLIPSSELSGMYIIDVNAKYIEQGGNNRWTENIYANSTSLMITWMANGAIYRWTQWGSTGPQTFDAYITIQYTKTSE